MPIKKWGKRRYEIVSLDNRRVEVEAEDALDALNLAVDFDILCDDVKSLKIVAYGI